MREIFHHVQFDYSDGMGGSVDRFKIDLYKAGGSGDCGTWITSICDKPTIGCKDASECMGKLRRPRTQVRNTSRTNSPNDSTFLYQIFVLYVPTAYILDS